MLACPFCDNKIDGIHRNTLPMFTKDKDHSALQVHILKFPACPFVQGCRLGESCMSVGGKFSPSPLNNEKFRVFLFHGSHSIFNKRVTKEMVTGKPTQFCVLHIHMPFSINRGVAWVHIVVPPCTVYDRYLIFPSKVNHINGIKYNKIAKL